MSNTAKKCEGAKLRGDVNLFPARESAWARGTILMDAAAVGVAQKEDREEGVDE